MKNSEKFLTAKERAEAFVKHAEVSGITLHGGDERDITRQLYEAAFAWLDLESETDEALPCPFCGSHTVVEKGTGCFYIHCSSCNYESPADSRPIDVIAAHNRVARAAAKKTSDAVQFDDDGKRALCESCTHWHVGCTYGLRYGTDPCEKYEARAAKEKEAK